MYENESKISNHDCCVLSRLVQLLGADDDGVPEAGDLDAPLVHVLDLHGGSRASASGSGPRGTAACNLHSSEQNCKAWLKFGLVCAWLPRASRHTARAGLPGGGVLDVQVVVLHLVLHLEGRPGQVVVEPRGDLVAPHPNCFFSPAAASSCRPTHFSLT